MLVWKTCNLTQEYHSVCLRWLRLIFQQIIFQQTAAAFKIFPWIISVSSGNHSILDQSASVSIREEKMVLSRLTSFIKCLPESPLLMDSCESFLLCRRSLNTNYLFRCHLLKIESGKMIDLLQNTWKEDTSDAFAWKKVLIMWEDLKSRCKNTRIKVF